MKRSDIAMIVLIASVGILVAFFATRAIFGSASNETVNVQTVDAIGSDIEEPDPAIFNENAINPTWSITVGTEQATTPGDTGASSQNNLNAAAAAGIGQ